MANTTIIISAHGGRGEINYVRGEGGDALRFDLLDTYQGRAEVLAVLGLTDAVRERDYRRGQVYSAFRGLTDDGMHAIANAHMGGPLIAF